MQRKNRRNRITYPPTRQYHASLRPNVFFATCITPRSKMIAVACVRKKGRRPTMRDAMRRGINCTRGMRVMVNAAVIVSISVV